MLGTFRGRGGTDIKSAIFLVVVGNSAKRKASRRSRGRLALSQPQRISSRSDLVLPFFLTPIGSVACARPESSQLLRGLNGRDRNNHDPLDKPC